MSDRQVESMGAVSQASRCALCQLGLHEHGFVYAVDPNPTFFSVSVVPAPRCEGCKNEMQYADATDWVCTSETCESWGIRVNTGLGGIVSSPRGP